MAGTGTSTKVPFTDASPAEIREAILPEERDQFDASYRRALDAAAKTLRLDELDAFLEHWRRLTWCHTAHGHDAWRKLLARAEHTLRTGERPPGMVPMEQMEALIRQRLGR